MNEHLSSAAQDKQPTRLFDEDGNIRDVKSDETDDYYAQKLARTELGFEDFDAHNNRDSARMTAAAKLEEVLLDLDERGAGADEKAEAEAALAAVTTIEPDKERGLSRIGVASKEVERLERYVQSFRESGDKRLDEAVARLNTARLVVDALTSAEDEQSAINVQHDSEVQARIANSDAHNALVRRNRYRRNQLKQAA